MYIICDQFLLLQCTNYYVKIIHIHDLLLNLVKALTELKLSLSNISNDIKFFSIVPEEAAPH